MLSGYLGGGGERDLIRPRRDLILDTHPFFLHLISLWILIMSCSFYINNITWVRYVWKQYIALRVQFIDLTDVLSYFFTQCLILYKSCSVLLLSGSRFICFFGWIYVIFSFVSLITCFLLRSNSLHRLHSPAITRVAMATAITSKMQTTLVLHMVLNFCDDRTWKTI
jgi:hypothetical protein